MSMSGDMSSQFALDVGGFQHLQHNARIDPESGVHGASQQFEALFVQMMMKSMRASVPDGGLLNSSATTTYQQMLDQQWSQVIASKGIGFADVLVDQLQRSGAVSGQSSSDQATQALIAGIPRGTPRVLDDPIQPNGASGPSASAGNGRFMSELDAQVKQSAATHVESAHEMVTQQGLARDTPEHVQRFLATLTEPAQAASRASGVPAELILAQAALETGWGRHEIPTHQGRNSHNLFGIKAGSHWQGDTTDIVTHEFINGQRHQVVDTFRVYDSFEDAFTDYANLIGDNPRYAAVTQAPNAAQAAVELQRGGYATDPRYAEKLVSVMNTMGPLNAGQSVLADSR